MEEQSTGLINPSSSLQSWLPCPFLTVSSTPDDQVCHIRHLISIRTPTPPHWKTPFEAWLSLWHSSLELPFGTHFAKIPGDSDSDFRKYTLMILCPRLVQWSFQGVNLENISEQSRLVSRLLNHTMWTPSSLRCDHNTRYDYPVFIYWTLPACSAAKQPFYTIASFIAWKCSETSIAFLPLQAKTRRLGEVKQLI